VGQDDIRTGSGFAFALLKDGCDQPGVEIGLLLAEVELLWLATVMVVCLGCLGGRSV
jgi:hypothetical protein